jgi:hypothetical protein
MGRDGHHLNECHLLTPLIDKAPQVAHDPNLHSVSQRAGGVYNQAGSLAENTAILRLNGK